MIQANAEIDVSHLLGMVRAPTLVVHARGDLAVPFEQGREIAGAIPNARLVPIESDRHAPGPEALLQIRKTVLDFLLEEQPEARRSDGGSGGDASALATIFFTDMEGSTALAQRLGDAMAQELLRAHNAVIRDALKAHGGSEVKHTGDGIMASFGSTAKALECAVAIQRAFGGERGVGARPRNEVPSAAVGAVTESPAGPATPADASPLHPDDEPRLDTPEPIRVRIGLNAGEPVAEDGDLFGATVQLAARVRTRAEPGQTLAANVVRELAMGKGFLFADLGDFVAKGFEEPVRLYEVRWREDG